MEGSHEKWQNPTAGVSCREKRGKDLHLQAHGLEKRIWVKRKAEEKETKKQKQARV